MRYLAVLFATLVLAACSTTPVTRSESQAGSPGQVLAPELQEASMGQAAQFLVAAAATDFHTHRPTYPAHFRDVRLGHVMTREGEKQYMLCGQFIARSLELLRGQRPAPLETFEGQLRLGGHCSIQSVRSLRLLLGSFENAHVWPEFSARGGALKEALNRLHLTSLLAHHLFAVGQAPGPNGA